MRANKKSLLFTILWLMPVLAGFAILLDYHSRAGPAPDPPQTWPRSSKLEKPLNKQILLVFLHPKCPCSAATISELARLLPRLRETQVIAVLTIPAGAPPQFANTEALDRLRSIPGLAIITDTNAQETRNFKAVTSGEVLLYDKSGHLRFCGGITPGRGHQGDSAGKDMLEIISSVNSGKKSTVVEIQPGVKATAEGTYVCPIFGCPLLHDSEQLSETSALSDRANKTIPPGKSIRELSFTK